MAKYEIHEDRPLPEFSSARSSTSAYPFDDMTKVGQHFRLPYEVYTTENGVQTNTYQRMRGVVNQRNARNPRKTFNLELDEAAGEVRVFLWKLDPDAPMPAPKPRKAATMTTTTTATASSAAAPASAATETQTV